MSLTRLVTIAAVAAVAAQPVSAQKPDATLARAIAAYSAAETMSVRFDQTVTNPLTDRALSSRGELVRKRPNLLSISFSSPVADRIVADGTSLWVYLPSSAPGQVIRMPAAAGQGMMVDPLGQILSAPAGRYGVAEAGTASVNGRATHAIVLTPRTRNALFTRATLWIDDANGLVRQLETTEPSGLVRRITVTQFRTNLTLPASVFQFVPPPNVRVVDGGGMAG